MCVSGGCAFHAFQRVAKSLRRSLGSQLTTWLCAWLVTLSAKATKCYTQGKDWGCALNAASIAGRSSRAASGTGALQTGFLASFFAAFLTWEHCSYDWLCLSAYKFLVAPGSSESLAWLVKLTICYVGLPSGDERRCSFPYSCAWQLLCTFQETRNELVCSVGNRLHTGTTTRRSVHMLHCTHHPTAGGHLDSCSLDTTCPHGLESGTCSESVKCSPRCY